MLIEPSDGGVFVGLKNTVAECAAPATNIVIEVNTSALADRVAVFNNDCWEFLEMGSGVLMGRASVEEDSTIG